MACVSEASRNWQLQCSFSHWRCNIASLKCKNDFLTREYNFFQKSSWLSDYSVAVAIVLAIVLGDPFNKRVVF